MVKNKFTSLIFFLQAPPSWGLVCFIMLYVPQCMSHTYMCQTLQRVVASCIVALLENLLYHCLFKKKKEEILSVRCFSKIYTI